MSAEQDLLDYVMAQGARFGSAERCLMYLVGSKGEEVAAAACHVHLLRDGRWDILQRNVDYIVTRLADVPDRFTLRFDPMPDGYVWPLGEVWVGGEPKRWETLHVSFEDYVCRGQIPTRPIPVHDHVCHCPPEQFLFTGSGCTCGGR